MKKLELREIIKEEYQKVIKEAKEPASNKEAAKRDVEKMKQKLETK